MVPVLLCTFFRLSLSTPPPNLQTDIETTKQHTAATQARLQEHTKKMTAQLDELQRKRTELSATGDKLQSQVTTTEAEVADAKKKLEETDASAAERQEVIDAERHKLNKQLIDAQGQRDLQVRR